MVEPLERLTFFVDRSFGRRVVVDILRSAGFQVIALHERFPDETRDEHWLRVAGESGWIVLTKDKLREQAIERRTAARFRVRVIIFKGKGLKGEELAALIVRHARGIERLCASESRPFLATLDRSGVHLRRPARDLLDRGE